jgi:hypothetical protein
MNSYPIYNQDRAPIGAIMFMRPFDTLPNNKYSVKENRKSHDIPHPAPL